MHLTSPAPPYSLGIVSPPPSCSHGDVSLMALRSGSLEECGQLDAALYWPVKCHWEPLPEAGGGEGHFRTVEIIPFLLSVLEPRFCLVVKRDQSSEPGPEVFFSVLSGNDIFEGAFILQLTEFHSLKEGK